MDVPLNTNTQYIYSTSGNPASIVKYNTGLQKLGLHHLVYFTFDRSITPAVYAGVLRAPFCRGGAVTAHNGLKSTIIPYLDVVEPLALQCRAVNTVIRNTTDGKLYGYNTDVHGLRRALLKGLQLFRDINNTTKNNTDIKTAVIYGTGGVSGVAWYVLKELLPEDGHIILVGRNPAKVVQKRSDLGIQDEQDPPYFAGPYDLVVDATPLASQPSSAWPGPFRTMCAEAKIVFCHAMPEPPHINYLQQFCQHHHVAYIPGSWMHVAQMVKQYSLYFAQEKDKEVDDDDTIPRTTITEEDICATWNLELP